MNGYREGWPGSAREIADPAKLHGLCVVAAPIAFNVVVGAIVVVDWKSDRHHVHAMMMASTAKANHSSWFTSGGATASNSFDRLILYVCDWLSLNWTFFVENLPNYGSERERWGSRNHIKLCHQQTFNPCHRTKSYEPLENSSEDSNRPLEYFPCRINCTRKR